MALELSELEGIMEEEIIKLKQIGLFDVGKLANVDIRELTNKKIFSVIRAEELKKLAQQKISEETGSLFGFKMGGELKKDFDERSVLKTHQPKLDEILGGGFETKKVYELYGTKGTGKTNLLHQLICLSRRPVDKGGLDSPATIYLDVEGNFSQKRLEDMAPFWGVNHESIMKSIAKANPKTSDELVSLCENQIEKIVKETSARLILLDSIASHFRSEYGKNLDLLPERQQKINRVLHAFKRAATRNNLLVIVVNQVSFKDNPALGHVAGHESQIRLKIEKNDGQDRQITVEKAVDLPVKTESFVMTEWGFLDPDIEKLKNADESLTIDDTLKLL